MQDNNRYLNLLRATELAKRKGEPYVPYDGHELEMFTKFAAQEHLPVLDNDGPEGWLLYATVSSENFNDLVEKAKVYCKNVDKTFGIMVSYDRKAFLVFVKQ